jgi:hypothetical protein
MALFAQIADSALESLKPYGIAGICVAFFMGRDLWRDARDAKREEDRERRRDDQATRLMEAVERQTAALNHLTQAMTLEVLTRPGVVQRAKDEAQKLQDAISKG